MGSVVVSVDAELGWGFHDYADPPMERIEAARAGWRTLLDLFDEYDVPATWAVVGHLMLADCDGEHAAHPAPPGWFASERGRWADRPDLRFAGDLVDAVLDADADHEVGSHTFSHVEFGAASTTAALARAELEAGEAAARERGLTLRSLVLPRNDVGHLDVVARSAVDCYRGPAPEPRFTGPVAQPVRKLARATVSRRGPPLVTPAVDEHGLVNVPASLYLFGFEGAARRAVEPVVGDPVVTQAKRGVRAAAAADGGGVCHLWLHPNNVTGEADARRLRRVLRCVAATRDRTALRVETMADVADRVLAADSRATAASGTASEPSS